MNHDAPTAQTPAATDSTSPSTRLSGRWLVAGRAVWLLLFALALAPFLTSLPGYGASIEHPLPDNAALPPGAAVALTRARIRLDVFASVSVGVACVVVLVSIAIALLLVWRRGDHRRALPAVAPPLAALH